MVVLLLFGCGKSAQQSASSGATDSSAIAGGSGETGAPYAAPNDTPWVSDRWQQPRARYDSYEIACDSARAIATRAFGRYAQSAEWSTKAEKFLYRDEVVLRPAASGGVMWTVVDRDTEVVVRGPHMSLENETREGPSVNHLQDAFTAAGWAEDGWYSADGSDGTTFGMVSREALCFVEASWAGGDDSDTTYEPPPGIKIQLRVVPRSPGR